MFDIAQLMERTNNLQMHNEVPSDSEQWKSQKENIPEQKPALSSLNESDFGKIPVQPTTPLNYAPPSAVINKSASAPSRRAILTSWD
ncbi:unnamed protein product [Didymodactylos carnosus]|uniref:Uncharacterized protein n=1 Tax=Didymodactylos carnosus TaxID=1234261 RepID=A0A815KNK8_9BILA|nr:unnamed protein product [Didymodactylos carnosus]CAF4289843.1 unnamed protein product [Didymodactylos carnosus]